jgi:uncharacterized protein YjbJ (UPF0337 family)
MRVKNIGQAGYAIGDKGFGLALEAVGTFSGNDRLKQAGRQRQEAASERLTAFEEEARAAARAAKAELNEKRQMAHQDQGGRSRGRNIARDPSGSHAAAEGAKGVVKQAAGKVLRSEDMESEGDAQRDKARDEAAAAKHESKATAHRKKAEAHAETSERLR